MNRPEKIALLRELENQGIVSETCPSDNCWHFDVLSPDELPEELVAEYKEHGEIRW